MDRDVMSYFVEATVKDTQAVLSWCEKNISEENLPEITVLEKNNRSFMVRARFEDKHTATIFRIFWDGNVHH
jgi:hypothetical protein